MSSQTEPKAWIIQRKSTTAGSSRRAGRRLREVEADRLVLPERLFVPPPRPFFRFRLEFADRDRFDDDPLRDEPLFRVPPRPEPLLDAAAALRPVLLGAPEGLGPPAFGLTVVGRITSGGSSL
ncbi:MAG: hypothetical protein FWE35_18415 [Streptosporangiales bacterium]|jgi:hypothetical protein|nr:hypothetical protein [Streptosporangiales bacterium]